MNKATVFDFDGTLTNRDTLLPMALFFATNGRFISFGKFFYYYLGFKLTFFSNEELKRRFSKYFFKGKSVHQINKILLKFLQEKVDHNSSVYHDFLNSRSENDRVIIVSANFDVVIKTWLQSNNIGESVEVIATNLVCYNDIYTGEIHGNVCRGAVKSVELKKILDVKNYYIVSYADEASDIDIMSLADEQHWV